MDEVEERRKGAVLLFICLHGIIHIYTVMSGYGWIYIKMQVMVHKMRTAVAPQDVSHQQCDDSFSCVLAQVAKYV